uniref:Uncharacterized protein n=1 Tax=Trypanosoma vivax (strain Y486) TaxID=1055687 RepID=G0U5T2_TRYVY|nr:conserved hypothetical protein [Trypanosoma vivax Y486]
MKPDEGRDSEFSDAQQQQRSSLENRRPDCGRLGVAGFSRASILDAAPVCASGAVSELERVSICDPQEHGTPQTRSTERKLRGSLGHLGKAGDVATSLTAARKSSSTLSRSLSSLHTMSWNKKRLHTSASANAILSEMSPTNGVRRLRNNPPTQSHSRSYVVKGTSRVSNKSAVSDCSNSRSNSLSLPSSPFQPVNESSDGCTSEPCCNNHGVIATEYKTSGGNVQKIVREVAYNNFFTDEDIPFVSTRSFRRRSLSPR